MKHLIRLTALLLCLSLCACTQTPPQPQGPTAPTGPIHSDRPRPNATTPSLPGSQVTFSDSSAVKVEYTINLSSVRYITSADRLPHYEALEKYGEEFFKTKALVVILDSVNSGAIQPTVASITFDNGKNTVVLGREIDSTVTIPVKTTWLLWVEVEKDLPGTWVIHNPSLPSNSATS